MATKQAMQAPASNGGGATMKPLFAKAARKAEVEIETEGGEKDTEAEDEEEGNEMTEKAKKSMSLTEDDLQKSLDKLGALATAGRPESRKDVLLKKAQVEELNKSEKAELFQLLGGDVEPVTPTLSKSIQDAYEGNEVLQKATDVSDYLDESQKALLKSLTLLSDRIEAGDTRQHEFNLVLAKSVSGLGRLIKGMSERLGVIETQPVRAPKSRGVTGAQVLHKGFGGHAPAEESLSHNQILEGLDGLMQKSMADGKGGFTEAGENILTATAKFEQTRQITPSLLQEINRFHQSTKH